MARSAEDKYTDPELRQRLKDEIQDGDRGGRPGQWSARKAQLLKQEYEKAGGGYKGGKDETQQHLSQWSDEDWQTKDGGGKARKDGETSRYLPKKAWEDLSPEERERAERSKREGSRKGRQHVPNPRGAKEAGRRARSHEPLEGYDDMTVGDLTDRLGDLDDTTLEKIRDYERDHKDRSTLLRKVESRLG